jgi:large subunit ribosomal protein L19
MNTEIIRKVQKANMEKKLPELNVGDTVEVETIIRDGDKQRIQIFKGIIIAIKNGGNDRTFTVRKISYGVGVEKIFPMYSTNIASIKVLKHAAVRRSKLYYMRKRIGKAAMKLKAGDAVAPIEHEAEAQIADVSEDSSTTEVVSEAAEVAVTESTTEATKE